MTLPPLPERLETTRRSWNVATANHNAHKGDQAAALRDGAELLFPEERKLLGTLKGRTVVHLQCNAGQDTLCLARRGAQVTGVDFSDEAIAFAQQLSRDAGLAATFVHDEVTHWLSTTPQRFDVAFASYGVLGWHEDLAPWFSGVERVLAQGGRLVLLEFHPLLWSYGEQRDLRGDDYFQTAPFTEPVNDYVASSAGGLGGSASEEVRPNAVTAYSYQHTLGAMVSAAASAGLVIESLVEYPYANGFKAHPMLITAPGRRWVWPEWHKPVPLMFSLVARKGEAPSGG
jgi:SAM-dependent methyltransferase